MRQLIACTVLVLLFAGCKKYDEGPALSLRSKKSRVDGDWSVKSYVYNNTDGFYSESQSSISCSSGGTVNYTNSYQTLYWEWNFDKNGTWSWSEKYFSQSLDYTPSYNSCYSFYNSQEGTNSANGTWTFEKDKEYIQMVVTGGDVYDWKIIELKEKEMKLQYDKDQEHITITLTKK